jgi:hypothetical protein
MDYSPELKANRREAKQSPLRRCEAGFAFVFYFLSGQ